MTVTVDVAHGAEPLARVMRGDLVESVHTGHLVVLAPDGTVAFALGDPDVTIWARSSLKPLQAVALLRSGLVLDPVHLAIAAASHDGSLAHLVAVGEVLTAAGLAESALRNTPDVPLDPAASLAWRAAGRGPTSLTQNCSGKHAAMLATCVQHGGVDAGWDPATYLSADHPVQRAVRATIEDLTGVPVTHVTVDGCGAPLFSTTLVGLARAFATIAHAPSSAPATDEARVARAMTEHPELIGGPSRDVTRVMTAVPGLVAKDGADGVYAAGLAFKVLDGSARPRPAVLVAALLLAGAALVPGVDLPALRALGRTPVLGHGHPVGAVTAAFGGSPAGVA